MKHKTTLLLALGLAALGAAGQDVVVVLNDGTSQKFNSDRVKELRFVEVPETPPVEFKDIEVNVWGSLNNVGFTFTDADGKVKLETEIWGPGGEAFLHEGTYECDPSGRAYTFDPEYTKLTIGDDAHTVTAGTITVSLSGRVYGFVMDLTLDNGEEFSGSWSGELPTYTPWLSATMTAAKYNENPQAPGTFYVKLNDTAYDYEMALVFTADASATELPAGTYEVTGQAGAGTLTEKSYVNVSRPYISLKLQPGSKVVVSKDGDEYDISMDLILSDGRTAEFTYKGKIAGTPTFETPEPQVETYTYCQALTFGGGYTCLRFNMLDSEYPKMQMDVYGSEDTTVLEEGEYIVGAETGLRITAGMDSYLWLSSGFKDIMSGKMTVSKAGDVTTIEMDFVLKDDSRYLARFEGQPVTD